jgi:hypothetical protein
MLDEPEPKETQPTQPQRGEPVEIPIPKRSAWDRVLGRATAPKSGQADEHKQTSEDH